MHSFRSAARMCRRPSCQGPASATLSFSYETAEVLLFDLVEERHPSRWDLCRTHADTLGVPRGWSLTDDRGTATSAPVADGAQVAAGIPRGAARAGTASPDGEAMAEGDPPAVAHAAPSTGRRNRYAELSARLPELAGQHAGAAPSTERSSAPHGHAGDQSHADAADADPPSPLGVHTHGVPDVLVDERVPGQLSMTLPEAAGEAEAVWGYAGNVVPLLRRESVLGSVT